jgi:preprotein translocase subunit YajC
VNQVGAYLPLVVLVILGYLLLIRPARRRSQRAREFQSALAVGDSVMLTSGVFATIVDVEGETVRVEVAPGVVLRVLRGAVGQVINDLPPPGGPDEYDGAPTAAGELPGDNDPGVN